MTNLSGQPSSVIGGSDVLFTFKVTNHGPTPPHNTITSLNFPAGTLMNRSLTIRTGQTHVQRYHHKLLKRIEAREIDPSFVITHQVPLSKAPEMYRKFRDKEDGCIKVVLKP